MSGKLILSTGDKGSNEDNPNNKTRKNKTMEINNIKGMTAQEIADELNKSGYLYYGERARAWEGNNQSRIYFGRDFVTILPDGTITNNKAGKARALTIGDPAVEAIENLMAPDEVEKVEEKEQEDNKIIITEEGEINLSNLEREFGSYEFEGKTYYATRQMEYTDRVFPGSWHDAEEGETYIQEWSAPGYDEEGNDVEIFMAFEQVKGEEVEGENLDWLQEPSRVEAR